MGNLTTDPHLPFQQGQVVEYSPLMLIRKIYHRDGDRIEIITKLSGRLRLMMQFFSLCAIALSGLMREWTPEKHYWIHMAVVGVMTLPFGWGEFRYLIDPRGWIRIRARAFGLTIFQHTVDTTRFSSCRLEHEGDGEYALSFYGATGNLELTIDGIPDEEIGAKLANLISLADNQQELAMKHGIKDVSKYIKGFSSGSVILIYLMLFPIAPIIALVVGLDWTILIWVLAGGVALITYFSHWLRRTGGVYAVSREGGYIDRWDRKGLFHAIDYRHHIGEDPVIEIIRERFDPGSIKMFILPLLQAVLIGMAAIYSDTQSPQTDEDSPEAASVTTPDPDAVRRGTELFLDHKRRKEQQEHESPQE